MKKCIALILAAALALSLCGCCCCLSLPTEDMTQPTGIIQAPEASRPTDGKTEENPTQDESDVYPNEPPQATEPTETRPVEPPVEEPEDMPVIAYKTTQVQITVFNEDGTVTTKVFTPSYGENHSLEQLLHVQDGYRYAHTTFGGSVDKPLLKEWYDLDGYRESYEEHVYLDDGKLWYTQWGNDNTDVSTLEAYTYNPDGQIATFKRYYCESLEVESTYSYHEEGWLSSTVEQNYSEGITYLTAYNAYGDVVERYFDFGSGYTDGRNYQNTYADGVLVETIGYFKGEIETITRYDSQGREYWYQYFYEGEEYDRTEITYNGDKLESYRYYTQGELSYSYSNTYDHNGNISMYTLWDCYTGEYTWQYYYDGNQLVSIQCYSNDTLMTTFIFEAETVAVDQETADALSAIVQYIITNA